MGNYILQAFYESCNSNLKPHKNKLCGMLISIIKTLEYCYTESRCFKTGNNFYKQ